MNKLKNRRIIQSTFPFKVMVWVFFFSLYFFLIPIMAQKQPSRGTQLPFEQVVTIAHVGSITGPVAHVGKDNENGARLAIEDLNKQGLIIGGKRVHFILQAEDDAADPKQANSVAQKIVDAKIVRAVIGHAQSNTSIPASQIYFYSGIPQIASSVTSTKYTAQGFNTTFRVVANDEQLGRTLANYAANMMHVKRIAVIDDRTAYGQGMADEFIKSINSIKAHRLSDPLKIISREYTSYSATDFRAILTSIKKQKPELIFFGGNDASVAGILKQIRELDMPVKLMTGDAACTTVLPRLAGKSLANERVICGEAGATSPAYQKRLDDFSTAYKVRFRQEFVQYAPYTYDAVMVVASAMQNADSVKPQVYLPVLANIRYDGITGMIGFNARGDIRDGSVTLYTYRNERRMVLDIISSVSTTPPLNK